MSSYLSVVTVRLSLVMCESEYSILKNDNVKLKPIKIVTKYLHFKLLHRKSHKMIIFCNKYLTYNVVITNFIISYHF